MADFVFIRHAESMNNHLAATQFPKKEDRPQFVKVRQPNPELTADGMAQTRLVANRIVEEYYNNDKKKNGGDSEENEKNNKDGGAACGSSSSPSSAFSPRPVDAIWCSYLTRAIETAVAIQDAIIKNNNNINMNNNKDDGGNTLVVPVPAIHLDSDATEVGGHYQWDEAKQEQRGTPGFSNADVLARWPNNTFTFAEPVRNAKKGWNKALIQETHGLAKIRALKLVEKMEKLAAAAAAASPSPSSTAPPSSQLPPVVIVITHGDFFKTLLRVVAERELLEDAAQKEAEKAKKKKNGDGKEEEEVIGNNNDVVATPVAATAPPVVVEAPSSSSSSAKGAAPRRSCDATIFGRAILAQNIGNTSLCHFHVQPLGDSATIASVAAADDNDEGAAAAAPIVFFQWTSCFMADNAHVLRDAAQAEAVARFESKGKNDFEDLETVGKA